MDDKGSVGKISVSSDSVSTLNSEDFVLVSRLGDDTPSSTNNGSDDEKTGLKVRMEERREISEMMFVVRSSGLSNEFSYRRLSPFSVEGMDDKTRVSLYDHHMTEIHSAWLRPLHAQRQR